MDTVRQCLLRCLAKTNIVPADGAPGLEREREKKKREKKSLLNHHLCFSLPGMSPKFSAIRHIVYGLKDATNHSAGILALSPHQQHSTRPHLLGGGTLCTSGTLLFCVNDGIKCQSGTKSGLAVLEWEIWHCRMR